MSLEVRLRLVAAAIAMAVGPTAVRAQTTGPSPTSTPPPVSIVTSVHVTAALAPVPFESLTRSASALAREDLHALGVTALVDALRLLPGVDVRARGGRGVQTDLLVRGATFGQSLVLVDGFRLNNSQSGHHNGELPVALSAIARVELLSGPGSATHGADALGGTINVISREEPHAEASVAAGQHGYAAVEGSLSGDGALRRWALSGWANRSSGFMFDRDFRQGGAVLRGPAAPGWTADVRHQRRAFGANGFYGASPSFEWTDQTVAATRWARAGGGWLTTARGQYRNHGDHFRWDIARPGFAENRHRTNAVEAVLDVGRPLAARGHLTMGGSAGGDWIVSSNLGNRQYSRRAAFAEVRWATSARSTLQAGLRWDGYSTFGQAWSPSISGGAWLSPMLRFRASAARGFRVPTYTELYYRDPAHLASADLRAERGWSADAGLDWTPRGWLVSVSPYRRWDQDVIDWVKARSTDLWGTTNVRDVTTSGVEGSAMRRFRRSLVRVFVTAQEVDAPALLLLSKYVLDYTRRSAGLAIALPVAGGIRASLVADYRVRQDGQRYTLATLRLSRPVARLDVFLDVANALNERYTEVAGAAMPGRWVTAGVRVR